MKILKYASVGGIAAVVDISIFIVLVEFFLWHWFFSAVIGFILATFVNYFLSVKFIFLSGARFDRRTEIFGVFFISFFGLFFNQLFLFIFIDIFGFSPLFSKVGASGTVFFWNYLARLKYVF